MKFASRVCAHPLPYDTGLAADTCAALPDFGPELRPLLMGIAGCSPYLSGLMRKEAAWLEMAMAGPPEAALSDVLGAVDPAAPPLAASEAARVLRTAKRRVALWTALCDCGGVWSLPEVTGALSDVADRAVAVALRAVLAPLLASGKMPGQGVDALDDAAGLVVLAMGKGGARELNYSSDIDLICLFDQSRFAPADVAQARAGFVRVVRRAMALLSDITADGYVFRTDLRLRPDPSVTPVAVSMAQAERYYESMGRSWERAAFIKARPAAGDMRAGGRFLEALAPFVWRKHLDFATVEEAREMQTKIRTHKASWDDGRLDGRDLKTAPGGIREVEVFVQTRQLIAGGRDRSLRVPGTVQGLSRLASAGWIPEAAATALGAQYGRLRQWEHRLQMIEDAQTQTLPRAEAGWDRLARFLGHADTGTLRAAVRETVAEVQRLTAPLMADPGGAAPARTAPEVDRAHSVAARWRSYPALRSERSRTILRRLLPDLLSRFDRAARPDEALAQFESFLSRLPAGVQLFALFEANPHLIDLMVDIAATAPALSQYLARHAGVLDAVLDGDFFAPWPGAERLAADLTEALAAESGDYERRLDAARRWHKDWRFRIGVHHLRGLIAGAEAAAQYADLAEATLQGLLPVVCEEFAVTHGVPPGRGAVVLGMGSLGARSLAVTSDLDLIVIYDAPRDAMSDGRRALPANTYYARLTKAMVTALSARMAEGTLYEVDMRLRPSGRQGPVATSWPGFQSYQRNDAWVWEHLALTRARPVAGAVDLAADVEAFRQNLIAAPRDPAVVLEGLSDMRRRLAEAKPASGPWDVEHGPGSLQDIELVAAAGALLRGCPDRAPADQLAAGPWAAPLQETLRAAHGRFAAMKQTARLLTGGDLAPETLGQGGCHMLLREGEAEDLDGLQAALADHLAAARAAMEEALAAVADGVSD